MSNRFVFWQNINSMHQSSFLKALARSHEVTLVTTEADSGRSRMGWEEPELPGVRMLRFDETDWRTLVSDHRRGGDWHVFAGLQAFRKVHAAFVHASTLECNVGLYAEPLRMAGVTGLLKRIRGTLDGRRFGDKVGFVLCIGPESKRQFIQWGFPPGRLHAWAYVTEPPGISETPASRTDLVRGLFPASFIHRKGADLLVEAVERLGPLRGLRIDAYSIDPDDTNPWQKRLVARAHAGGILRIHPFIGNRSLVREMSVSDFTILPSRFDGWGAVVNESLSVGTPVIVSRHCGASALLDGRGWLGKRLDRLDAEVIATALKEAADSGRVPENLRRRISDWAIERISGERLCEYFLAIVARAEAGADIALHAPWETPQAETHFKVETR